MGHVMGKINTNSLLAHSPLQEMPHSERRGSIKCKGDRSGPDLLLDGFAMQ